MQNKTLQEEPKGKTTAEKKKAFAKYTVKDSVFSTIFQDKKYLIELYRALHPEDTETTEDALTDITIRNVHVPEPEIYVIFTGERAGRPETISLSKEFFGGKECAIEVKVKVLYGGKGNDIISQYVAFTKSI